MARIARCHRDVCDAILIAHPKIAGDAKTFFSHESHLAHRVLQGCASDLRLGRAIHGPMPVSGGSFDELSGPLVQADLHQGIGPYGFRLKFVCRKDARRQGCFLASCPWFLIFPFFFRKAPDTFNFLRHAMRAISSVRPKCSHRCVSLKETSLKPVQILEHTTFSRANRFENEMV